MYVVNRRLLIREAKAVVRRFRQYMAVKVLSRKRLTSFDFMLYRLYNRRLSSVRYRRYLQKRQPYRKFKLQARQRAEMFLSDGVGSFLNAEEFKNEYGMTREAFEKLYVLIKDHQVFTNYRKEGSKQVPPQLLVLLSFLRTEGSGRSNRRGRTTTFDIATGSLANYRDRCVIAINDTLKDQIAWPDEEERTEIATRIKRDFKLPICIGIADGTLVPLTYKPETDDYADYFSRKRCYALSVLIVNDDQRHIRYCNIGWPGCTHDDRVFRNSVLVGRNSEHFTPFEYIIGDSAYTPQPYMIPAYKKTANRGLERDEEIFNTVLSTPRVESEHTIGMLKGRWPFLRQIRMRIKKKKTKFSLKKIIYYVKCCCILHNLLLQDDDIQEYDDDVSVIDADNVLNQAMREHEPKDSRRDELKNYVMEKYY